MKYSTKTSSAQTNDVVYNLRYSMVGKPNSFFVSPTHPIAMNENTAISHSVIPIAVITGSNICMA